MKETYNPQPINTEGIELPEELIELREKIAENVHDIWAQQRFNKDGAMEKLEMMNKNITHA